MGLITSSFTKESQKNIKKECSLWALKCIFVQFFSKLQSFVNVNRQIFFFKYNILVYNLLVFQS